jgi:hypothetical protein
MVYACTPTQEDGLSLGVQDQPVQHNKTISNKKRIKRRKRFLRKENEIKIVIILGVG